MTKIELKNVSKTIKGKSVLRNISMTLEKGRVIGFSGVNGSGKTMLMRLIAGLIFPTNGEIIIDGKRLGKEIEFPESIGLLIENPSFLDYYSGFQNLKILSSIRKEVSEEEIRDIIRCVGLDPEDKKIYKKYSLGMKQRLGIAGALLEKPEILILDEPTNALDEDGVGMLKALVAGEKERGALVIVSCHDKEVLQSMTDEIYELREGSLIGKDK